MGICEVSRGARTLLTHGEVCPSFFGQLSINIRGDQINVVPDHYEHGEFQRTAPVEVYQQTHEVLPYGEDGVISQGRDLQLQQRNQEVRHVHRQPDKLA